MEKSVDLVLILKSIKKKNADMILVLKNIEKKKCKSNFSFEKHGTFMMDSLADLKS